MRLSLREIGEGLTPVGSVQLPPGVTTDHAVTGWSIDSRTLQPGDAYFALPGPHHDGHDYVPDVLAKGASAVVVNRAVETDGVAAAVYQVDDTLAALQRLARWTRLRWSKPIVAVTGSAGKTTTKEAIAQFLGAQFRVAKTAGNLNNHVGLPLSLLRFPDDSQVGVIEMGMNHAGEIRQLAEIALPQVGVVTNVGHAHVEYFDSIEGIALAKRELIEALPPEGTAVLNADDERVARFAEVHRGQVVTYGFSEKAQVRAEQVSTCPGGVSFTVEDVRFESPLVGRHGVSNILAGIAVAKVFDVPLTSLVEPAKQLAPGKMRGERITWKGVTILNDCYNSNPDAARFMIDVLRDEPAQRRIAVLGEMLELGRWSESLHNDVGRYAAQAGIDVLIGIHGASRALMEGGVAAGIGKHIAFYFEDAVVAGDFLRRFVQPGDAILFKGSRGTHVERALERMGS